MSVNCQHWSSAGCAIAGALCNQSVIPTTASACDACISNAKPRTVNGITSMLAFQWAHRNGVVLNGGRQQLLSQLITSTQPEASAKTSIIITTYSSQTLYTQACLEAIRLWKNSSHELIVVVHDESPLLRAYLDACASDGLINKLIFATSGHGHLRGYNLGVQHATGDVIFNICNDIIIGPLLVDDCAWKLRSEKQLGLIGWHWYGEGVAWENNQLTKYANDRLLPPEHINNIRNAKWFTGRYFDGIGGTFWINVCNTAFFGIRRDVLEAIGGGFGKEYTHYWADDFLSYAVLDQGLDISHFDARFRRKPYFSEFQYDNIDVEDRRRNSDRVKYNEVFIDTISSMYGGMAIEESIFLHLLAKSLPDGATITNVGVYLGSSAIVLLDAMKSKNATFHFIDRFDMPDVPDIELAMLGTVTQNDFLRNIHPFIGQNHKVCVHRANTLDMNMLPKSDLVFVDAGHTEKCIRNDVNLVDGCLNNGGVAVFHDYNHPYWASVKPAVDEKFAKLDVYQTMAVYRRAQPIRETYCWTTTPHQYFQQVSNSTNSSEIIEKVRARYTEIDRNPIYEGHIGLGSWIAYINVLTRLNKPIHTILEIGFNGGHSSAMFCEVFPNARVLSIDVANNPACVTGKKLIDKWYPGRHTLVLESSAIVLSKMRQFMSTQQTAPLYDLLFVDGSHFDGMPQSDMFNCQFLAHPNSIVIVDGVYGDMPYQIEPSRMLRKFIALGAYNEIGTWLSDNGSLGFSYGTFGTRVESLDLVLS